MQVEETGPGFNRFYHPGATLRERSEVARRRPALRQGPSGAFGSGRAGGGRARARTHPPHPPRRPAGGAAPLAHAPPRSGQAPSRRRAAAGGGSGPRFLSPGLRASSQRSLGRAELGCRRRDRRRPPAPAPPRSLPGGPAGVGSERGDRPAAPPSGPCPGQQCLPPQPACDRRSLRGVELGESPRPPIQRPGQPPAAGATFLNRTWVKAFGSGTPPGPRRLHCFLPPPPPAPRPRPFFPPRPRPRGQPPASARPSPLPLFTPAADAAHVEVARTAVPRESCRRSTSIPHRPYPVLPGFEFSRESLSARLGGECRRARAGDEEEGFRVQLCLHQGAGSISLPVGFPRVPEAGSH
ncbi:Titin [Manis pentadactyla]|nr:Titin [Manis pentadactyla]